jgi:hypothetical protein
MSYIGATPSQQLITPAIDYFSGNGVTTTFTLTRSVTSVFSVRVVVNGVEQNPRTAYTINQAGNLVFDGAPSAGTNNIYIVYNSQVGQFVTPSPGTVQPTTLALDQNGAFIVDNILTGLVPENIQSGSYTLALSDRGKTVAMQNSSAATVTVPPDSTALFPVGTVINLARFGAGTVTLQGGAGVTLTRSGTFASNEELIIRKRAANLWSVIDAPRSPSGAGGTISNTGIYVVHTYNSSGVFTIS